MRVLIVLRAFWICFIFVLGWNFIIKLGFDLYDGMTDKATLDAVMLILLYQAEQSMERKR